MRSTSFLNSVRIETEGFSEGIWVLWNSNVINVKVISSSRQVINMLIQEDRDEEWLLSCLFKHTREAT